MGRYMIELGMTPASRSRVAVKSFDPEPQQITIERTIVDPDSAF
jgi:hypothetical protein